MKMLWPIPCGPGPQIDLDVLFAQVIAGALHMRPSLISTRSGDALLVATQE